MHFGLQRREAETRELQYSSILVILVHSGFFRKITLTHLYDSAFFGFFLIRTLKITFFVLCTTVPTDLEIGNAWYLHTTAE